MLVTLRTGAIVDGTVRAIIERTNGIRLQVDYRKGPDRASGTMERAGKVNVPSCSALTKSPGTCPSADENLFGENQHKSQNIEHEHCENEQSDSRILAHDQQSEQALPILGGVGESLPPQLPPVKSILQLLRGSSSVRSDSLTSPLR